MSEQVIDKWDALRRAIKKDMLPHEDSLNNKRLPANIRRDAEDTLYILNGVLRKMEIFDSYEKADLDGTRGE